MKFARVLVALSALMFAAFGLRGLFDPLAILEMVHFDGRDPTALNEARAMYGGVELGIAAFLVACLLDRWSLRAGLFLSAAIFTSAAAARAKSMVVDGMPDPVFVNIAMFEAGFAIACVVALARASAPEVVDRE